MKMLIYFESIITLFGGCSQTQERKFKFVKTFTNVLTFAPPPSKENHFTSLWSTVTNTKGQKKLTAVVGLDNNLLIKNLDVQRLISVNKLQMTQNRAIFNEGIARKGFLRAQTPSPAHPLREIS